jgi:hypothetical protein
MTYYNYVTLYRITLQSYYIILYHIISYYRRSPEGLTQAPGILETHAVTPPAGTAHLLGIPRAPTQPAAVCSQHPAPGTTTKKKILESQSPSIYTRHSN